MLVACRSQRKKRLPNSAVVRLVVPPCALAALVASLQQPGERGQDGGDQGWSRAVGGRRPRRRPQRIMLRGKARLNVELLGHSPGLYLERRPSLAVHTPPHRPRRESSLASTLKTLLFFTALMITVPIGLYFTTKSYLFEGALGMSSRDSYFYAAIVAVVAVHVVLALFLYVAWNEGSRQWREGKQD
ncbi:vacuolar ATPase assembly integral membrane protein VMA21 isoform 2-T2 [Trichechus inunguis]